MTDQNLNADIDKPYVPPTYEIWGQVQMDIWKAALVKGVGKVPYDPAQHKNPPVTAIKLGIYPIPEQNGAQDIERDLIAESRDWGLIQNTIMNLGLKPSLVNGKWAHVKLENSGETYTNANKEVKNKTYPFFIAVFDTEQACKDDYFKNHPEAAMAVAPAAQVTPANGNGNGNDATRKTAVEFAKAVIPSLVKDKPISEATTIVMTKLAEMPVIGNVLSITSPEIVELIQANAIPF